MILIIFTIFSFLALFASSINRDSTGIAISVATISIIAGFVYLIKNKVKLSIPKNFYWMFAFSLILFVYLPFMEDVTKPLYYALTFELSIFYWLLFYNLKEGSKILKILIYSTAVIASLIYIASFINPKIIKISELYFLESQTGRHYQAGNLWAFTLVLVAAKLGKKMKLKLLSLAVTGLLFIIISQARSAYVALAAGVFSLYKHLIYKSKEVKSVITIVLVMLSVLFISASINKSALFSRPYFKQSVESFTKYPFGIGMGNFTKISLKYFEETGDPGKFSVYTHNIYLEALSGVGILSIPFLVFLILSVTGSLKRSGVWSSLYIAMFISFMFDTSYTIPGLIWIWFMVYGASQRKTEDSHEI